ncbi:hypothetical protein ACJJTC_003085 [Scirpophaga incertulas]
MLPQTRVARRNIVERTAVYFRACSTAQRGDAFGHVIDFIPVLPSMKYRVGDSKERATYEKAHNVSGTGIKPESEYKRHVLDKESFYDTGKDGIPKSSTQFSEESVLYKDENILNKRISDVNTSDINIHSSTYQSTSSDIQSHTKDVTDITKTSDFVTIEKTKS